MRLLIVTYGTEGSTRPLVGLSRALMDENVDLCLLAERSTLRSARSQGIPVEALDGDLKAALLSASKSETNNSANEASPPVERIFAHTLIELARDNMNGWVRTILQHAQSADLILFSGIVGYAALCVAQHLELPAIHLGLSPETPTRHFPSTRLSIALSQRIPKSLNRSSHRLAQFRLWRELRNAVRRARIEVCQRSGPIRFRRNIPVLYGLSNYLLPQIDDWPTHCKICGPWSIKSGVWEPPPPLADFLADGPPPVYVGFGSISGLVPGNILSSLNDALEGRRVLFSPGWRGVDAAQLPKNFFPIGDMPHDWLFQHVTTAIHHGGAGTSHMAARAGVPSVVIPFTGSQFFWANRLHAMGIASEPVPFAQIDTQQLLEMIAQAERNSTRERAEAFASAMAMEEGTSYAIRHIKRIAGGKNSGNPRDPFS
ncbi:MAG: glycosyltransferase [Betaproteobacteria bacterium]|nr:glycosyltransferase [Betaproteobacteria bacterium]